MPKRNSSSDLPTSQVLGLPKMTRRRWNGTAKLLSRLPSTVLIMFILTVPALVAYGIVIDMGPFYYLAGVMVVAGAPLFSMAVGAIIAITLVLIFPVRRLNEYVSAVYILIGKGDWLAAGVLVIVVALVNGDATVKRLCFREHNIELQPENRLRKYRPIVIGPETDLRIVGKVVAVRGAAVRD